MSAHNNSVMIGALLVGILSGALPLYLGATKNNLGLGLGGFAACVISGYILGLILAVSVSGVFVWLILREEKKAKANQLPPYPYPPQYPPQGSYLPYPPPQQKAPPPPQPVAAPPARFCTHCGRENPAEANFCDSCGERLG